MWNTDSIWLDLAILNCLSAIGSMLLGHFEKRSGKARIKQVIKLLMVNLIAILISIYAGRIWVFAFFGAIILAVLYIHIIWLPKNGINGWTSEPRKKYFKLRGWDQEIEKGDFE